MTCTSDNAWNWKHARRWMMAAWFCFTAATAFASQSVTLTWNPSPDANVSGYKIYYGGSSGVYTNAVVLGNVTNVTVAGLVEGSTYYFSATSVANSGAESAFSNEATYDIPAAVTNSPVVSYPFPSADPVADLTIYQNATAQVVVTNINSGLQDGNQNVIVSAVSSDSTIISTPVVKYSPGDSVAALTVTPVANALGTATVTVMVDNGNISNNLVSLTFTVTVAPAPTVTAAVTPVMPAMDALADLIIYQNAGMQTVMLTNISSGLADNNQSVNIVADTSDPLLIPMPTVIYTNGNNYGCLNFAAAANAFGTATVTVTVSNDSTGTNVVSRTFAVTVLPAQPPTLDSITNLAIYENCGAKTVALTGIGAGLGNGNQPLVVTAISSNPNIIPTPVVKYFSPSAVGSLTVVPVLNAVGTATVTVMVNNGGYSNSIVARTFTVTVLPSPTVNQPPTLAPISNLTLIQGAGVQTISLTGIGSGSARERQALRVTASSSNPQLVPTPAIRYSSPASTGVLSLRPLGANTGTAVITVTVNDGGRSNNIVRQTFTVTVNPNQAPTLDPISDLAIVRNAGSQTVTLSGITSGSPAENQTLRISAGSSNPGIVSVAQIRYSSPASAAQLVLRPGGGLGTATITVAVNDGGPKNNIIRRSFAVTVTAPVTANVGAKSGSGVPSNAAAVLAAVAGSHNQFSFHVDGISGAKYAVQATTDLTHWVTLQTNTAPFTFQDPASSGANQRFYRAFYVQ